MNQSRNPYKRYRFPPEIIQYAVWPYYRFNLSHRHVEDLQAQRFLDIHAADCSLFNLERHLISARHYRELRHNAFASWETAVAA